MNQTLLVTRALLLLVARKLLGAPGRTTRNKKLLVTSAFGDSAILVFSDSQVRPTRTIPVHAMTTPKSSKSEMPNSVRVDWNDALPIKMQLGTSALLVETRASLLGTRALLVVTMFTIIRKQYITMDAFARTWAWWQQ